MLSTYFVVKLGSAPLSTRNLAEKASLASTARCRRVLPRGPRASASAQCCSSVVAMEELRPRNASSRGSSPRVDIAFTMSVNCNKKT